MTYPYRQAYTFNTRTGAVIADNTDIYNLVIPAGKEIEIHDVKAMVRAISGASSFFEICKDDNTVLCKVVTSSTGVKSAVNNDGVTATTFPIRVAPQSTTASTTVKVRTDVATTTSTDVSVQIIVGGL